jgi:hypothetical protein
MVIQISVDTTQPLAGTAAAERGAPVPFTGWLELLQAISGLVATAATAGDPDVAAQVGLTARDDGQCDTT